MRTAGLTDRFVGEIAGTGTRSGVRLVIGRWVTSPFGPFTDVMVEQVDGHRVLLAPTETIAEYVSTVYSFLEVVVTPVDAVRADDRLTVRSEPLSVHLAVGGRDALGRVLHAVPHALASSARWAAVVDPICRVALRGVRTRAVTASAVEYYAATDRHRITAVTATWREQDLGAIADVAPPVRFGGGSTPRRPSIVAITTTVRRHAQVVPAVPARPGRSTRA